MDKKIKDIVNKEITNPDLLDEAMNLAAFAYYLVAFRKGDIPPLDRKAHLEHYARLIYRSAETGTSLDRLAGEKFARLNNEPDNRQLQKIGENIFRKTFDVTVDTFKEP